ncbi:peptidase [Tamlana nanhaiensis]|uniref:Peptidase n=1 Tax=Neotamlana nanhaiensis TaxID=1382798 RepID=A0A0D7W8A6_9FLAO|nr:type II CAAX endopeptidase family protein [Tamlana nanhaiensis]KJD34057.1 peptidase [Tamlana nanhaiensis]
MNNNHKGWQRVLLILIPYFIIVSIFQLIGYLLAGFHIKDIAAGQYNPNTYQQMIITLCGLFGTLIVVWIFLKFLDKETFLQIGLNLKNRLKDLIVGLFLGSLIMILAYFLLITLNEIVFIKTLFKFKELLYSTVIFSAVAIAEEVLFRGYILKNLMISFNKYFALLLSSLLFSLFHGANQNIDAFALLNLLFAGILLGISYIHTKNLWFPIAFHLSWNLSQTLVGFNVSGKDFYSIINFEILKNNTINGGNFGFEGSFFALITMIILIVIIDVYYRRKSALNKNI